MPDGGVRNIDNRRKFRAYLLTYSPTTIELDYAYDQLSKLQFPVAEVVEKNVDGQRVINAVLIGERGQRRRLSPDTAMIRSQRPEVRGFGSKAVESNRRYIRQDYIDARGLQDFEQE